MPKPSASRIAARFLATEERQYVEDSHPNTAAAQHVRELLSHWNGQHDYPGTSWQGVELLCFELAKATDYVAIQSAGWYKYPGSIRSDRDGKDWRYMFPAGSSAVTVNCHSLLHDDVWTLATTVFSTRDIETDGIIDIGHADHWHRTLLWTIETAKVLQTDGYNYGPTIAKLQARLDRAPELYQLVHQLYPRIAAAFEQVVSEPCRPPELSIGFGTARLSPTAIGRHEPPTDEVPYSIMTVNPKAEGQYLTEVVKHELLHYALGAKKLTESEGAHNDTFQAMAKLVGLPHKLRD